MTSKLEKKTDEEVIATVGMCAHHKYDPIAMANIFREVDKINRARYDYKAK
jgi:hypothetical protein